MIDNMMESIKINSQCWQNLALRLCSDLNMMKQRNVPWCHILCRPNIDDDNIFWDKLFDLKRFFNESWPDNYPLFCENERLFNLSDRAETICNDKNRGIESVSSDPCEFSIPMSCQHNFSLDDDMNEFVGDNFEYSLAA